MGDKKRSQMTVKVVQMDKHFLYLPFYYAQECNFFGYIPTNYKLELHDLGHFDHTDENAFKELILEEFKNNDVYFAICDPIEVLKEKLLPANVKPAVLGALVTNSAFWAVDHNTHRTITFKDLALYDKIISYKEGTTSYSIAERLYKISGKKSPKEEFIKIVHTNHEILELHNSPAGTIALSPNPFAIDSLIKNGDGKFKINLSLGTTPEYSNVLVTALLSTRDFVHKHPELVLGLIKALHRAILLIKHYDEANAAQNPVVTFVEKYFSDGKNASGALKIAHHAHVFPSSLEVNPAQWLNAVRANCFHLSQEKCDKLAGHTFDLYIEPYTSYASKAASEVIVSKIFPETNKGKFVSPELFSNKIFIVLANLVVFLSIAYLWNLNNAIVISSGVLLSLAVCWLFKLHENKYCMSLHFFAFAVLTVYTLFVTNVDNIKWIETPNFLVLGSLYLPMIAWEITIINKKI